MFGRAPPGPGGQAPSSSGLPTSVPAQGPLSGAQLGQQQQQQQSGVNSHSAAMFLPDPGDWPPTDRPKPPTTTTSAAPDGMDMSALGYPPFWGLGFDYRKPSLMDRLFGKRVEWHDPLYGHVPAYKGVLMHASQPQGAKLPKLKVEPSWGAPLPQPDPPTATDGTVPPASNARLPHRLKPLPTNWHELSRGQQKAILKDREREEKKWKRAEKEQVKLYKESIKEREREERAKAKMEKKARKEKERERLWRHKHPSNALPIPDPIDPYMAQYEAYQAAQAQAEKKAKPTPGPATGPGDPLTFMLLPTMEEFGVRRPFNAPGVPPAMGEAGASWPMMSRTMTHAIVDMNREEQIHAIHASTFHSPNW